jgi:hypothetical protein
VYSVIAKYLVRPHQIIPNGQFGINHTGVNLPFNFKEAYADLTSLSEALRQQMEDTWAAESFTKPMIV